MYNVAVCISGLPREWGASIERINKFIIKPLDADVFISIWEPDDLDVDVATWDHIERRKHDNNINIFDVLNHYSIECSIDTLEIESFIDKENLFSGKNISQPAIWASSYDRALPMCYKIKKAYKLLENYSNRTCKKYDIVIRLRTELLISDYINNRVLASASNGKLMIPGGYDTHDTLNDRMALSSQNIMKLYCDWYDYIETYCNEGCQFHPELLLKYHVERCNLDVERFEYCVDIADTD